MAAEIVVEAVMAVATEDNYITPRPIADLSLDTLSEDIETSGTAYFVSSERKISTGILQTLGELAHGLTGGLRESEVTTVSQQNNEYIRYIANTNLDMPLHTDNVYLRHPCRFVMLLCVEPAISGGETILANGADVFHGLETEHQNLLRQSLWTWKGGDMIPRPVIGLYNKVRWWKDRLQATDPQLAEVAEQFDKQLHHPDKLKELMLGRGDLLVIDNHRVLHGRRAFSGERRKLMRFRIW